MASLQGQIRAVYQRPEDGPWRFVIGRCIIGAAPSHESEEIYPGSVFVCKSLPALPVASFIKQLAGDGLELSKDLPPLKISVNNPSWTEQVVPSDVSANGVPRRLFSTRVANDAYFLETQLAAYGMPYHASSAAYAKAFLDLTRFHGNSDKGELLIEFDDDRGIIRMGNGTLSIAGRMKKLCLVGQLNGEEPIRLMKGERTAITVEEIRDIELWLLTNGNEVLDFRSSTGWPHRYEPAGAAQYRDEVRDMIAKGESEVCEFKPYIDLAGSDKALEIQKSVCAFSNAQGGRLFLGVSKEAEVGGLARGIVKAYGGSVGDASATYIKSIEEFLRETLKNNQCFSIDKIDMLGGTVIVITIEKSSQTNYLLNTRQAFVRTGATNMKMSPQEIVAHSSTPLWLDG